MQTFALVAVVLVALAFDYTNGFHDAANAIATSVGSRALKPRAAILMAAVMNLVGALIATGVAATVAAGIVDITPADGTGGLIVVLAALAGAIAWNLVTWYLGLPSSSTHALIGGLVGGALASATTVKWSGVVDKVVVPMVASPLVGLVAGYLVMVAFLWIFRRAHPGQLGRTFRVAQAASAAAMAVGHGLQDAQKTMGVIVLALITTGHHHGSGVPAWVKVVAAAAMAAGTLAGGWRVTRTLGRRVIEIDPARGFAAESVSSSILYLTAFVWTAPISSTHVISSSILGVGATRRASAVRWGVASNILVAWVLTLPASAAMAAAAYGMLHWLA